MAGGERPSVAARLRRLRRRGLALLATLALALGLGLATAAPAAADSLACNLTNGQQCGKVWNMSGRWVQIYDGKRIRDIAPGSNSRAVGMRDVMRYSANFRHTHEFKGKRVTRNAGSYGVSDSTSWVYIF